MLAELLCVVGALAASPPAEQWIKGYTFGNAESHPHAGVQTADGGYFMVGDGIDYNNQTVVKRHIFALKADATGTLLWQTDLGTCGWNYGKNGVELSDGTLLLGGALSTGCGGGVEHGQGASIGVLHRALVRLDGATGHVLSTQLLPNAKGALQGLRDGFMGLAAHGNGTVVATGFVGGESASTGYPDEPMFLIAGGQASLTKFTYVPRPRGRDGLALTALPAMDVAFDVRLDVQGQPWTAWQGMRVLHEAERSLYIVSSTGVQASDPDKRRQMSLFAAQESDGATVFAAIYPAAAAPEGGHASHPYALTKLSGGGAVDGSAAVYAIGGLAVRYDDKGIEQCQGRALGLDINGAIAFDARFAEPGADENTECYGIIPAAGGGAVLTCGAGVEPELHPKDSDMQKTWRVLLHGLSSDGSSSWQKTYTDAQQRKLQNNAGENLIRTADGGIAVLVDSQSWGSGSTGGNFALMKLAPEAGATAA